MKLKKLSVGFLQKLCLGLGILAASIAFSGSQEAQAVEVTEGNFVFDVDYYDYTAVLKKYKGTDLNVIIPATADGCTVTKIGSEVFEGYYVRNDNREEEYLKSIVIPGTVKTIGYQAFSKCKGITQIEIPSSVTTIEGYAFSDCTSLKKVEVPSSVTNMGHSVFSGCNQLIEVNLSSSLTMLSNSTFSGCSSLIGLTIPSSITTIESYAFSNCSSLIGLTIPSSITTIKSSAFSGCSSLTEISVPSSVTTIESYAFSSCTSLAKIEIPNSIAMISYNTFDNCTSLKTIIIPASVTSVRADAFRNCSNLTKSFILGNPDISSSAFPKSSELVIYGIKGSRVEEYCKNTGTHFTGFEAPILFEAKQSGKSITLSFSGVSGVNSYDVYRRDSSSDVYTKIGTAKGNFYQDTNVKTNTSYYYMIAVTYDLEGVTLKDILSDSINIYYEYITKPGKVPVIKLKKDGYRLNVKIKKQSVQYFELQYSTSKKFPSSATRTYSCSGDSTAIAIYKSSFQLKKKYYIRVRAYNKDSKSNCYYGKWSQVKSFKFKK